MTRPAPILAVDMCGTLFATNTTAELVMFHHARRANAARLRAVRRISKSGSWLRSACVIVSKLSGFDLHRALVLWSLRGEAPETLVQSASDFVATELPRHAIPATHARLSQMRASGWQPVLISNAIAPVVQQVAQQLNMPFVASELKTHNGRLTGTLARDLTGKKRIALEGKLRGSLETFKFAVITDNRSDQDLVAAADIAVLVSAGAPRTWMRNWNAEILCY